MPEISCLVCGKSRYASPAKVANGNGKFCSRDCYALTLIKTEHRLDLAAYSSWQNMKRRCQNPKSPSYKHYGARGIKYCDRWRSFDNFFADMGERPDGMELDRIDVNGDYCPENCRWADRSTQMINTRLSLAARVNYRGECVRVAELAARFGISISGLRGRIAKGWPEDHWADPPQKGRLRPAAVTGKSRSVRAEC